MRFLKAQGFFFCYSETHFFHLGFGAFPLNSAKIITSAGLGKGSGMLAVCAFVFACVCVCVLGGVTGTKRDPGHCYQDHVITTLSLSTPPCF